MPKPCKHCHRCADGKCSYCACCGLCQECGQPAKAAPLPEPVYVPYPVYPPPQIQPWPPQPFEIWHGPTTAAPSPIRTEITCAPNPFVGASVWFGETITGLAGASFSAADSVH